MRKFLLTYLVVLTFGTFSFGQLTINYGVDTTDTDAKRALDFYKKYYSEFWKGTTLPDFCKYWDTIDCKKAKYPDPILFAISGSHPTYNLGAATVIYIKPTGKTVIIKTHIGSTDSLGNIFTTCITNHYVDITDTSNLRFISPIRIASDFWQTKTVGNITYHYPSYHNFNYKKADSLLSQIQQLEKKWGFKPIRFDYYFADSKEKIQNLRGFDYSIDMTNRDRPSGIVAGDNMIFCAGLGENYFHEVVHLYFNPLYPKTVLGEGIAVFYGGSMGQSLDWHKDRLKRYLQVNPNTDFSKSFIYLDHYTNPGYTIQGLICKDAFERDKIEGLKRVMAYTTFDDLMLKEYNVTKDRWNEIFIRLISD